MKKITTILLFIAAASIVCAAYLSNGYVTQALGVSIVSSLVASIIAVCDA